MSAAACAVVTGGSGEIGAAIALRLGRDQPVCVAYHHGDAAARACAQAIEADGGQALAAECDVTDAESIDQLFTEAERRLGPVGTLVNCAGIAVDDLAVQMTEDAWRQTLDVNVTGAFLCARRALMPMVRARHGRIVNIASISALRAHPGQANYAASKAAMIALTRNLAVEVARRRVTVNAVAPGVIDTDMAVGVPEAVRNAIPARRTGTPEDVAACVAFLASNEAGYVNGAVISVDGGLSA